MTQYLIKNANLRAYPNLSDIFINGPIIEKIGKELNEKADVVIDAKGRLVAASFIDPHIHLDKTLISETVRENRTGTLAEAIEIIWEKKKNYTLEDIIDRASRVVEMGILHGTTFFRTHVDVDSIGGLKPLKGLLEVKKKYRGIADIQIVAFPQEGIIQDEGTAELMHHAMEEGADVVGGMPWNEMNEDDSKAHIDFCFELSKKWGRDIDMHVDETDNPNARTLEYLASQTIKKKYHGRVTAGHTCALSSYNPYHAQKVIALVKKAGVNMITNPATNLMLEGRLDQHPIRRGITMVKELLAAGVNVAYGQDCIKDTFYPTWGQADMLEVGMILAHAAQFTTSEYIEKLFDMPTINSAKILRLKSEEYGIKPGSPASLNIFDAPNVFEAFRTRADRLYVFKNGKIIARTKTEKVLELDIEKR
ncbi:MAG: amidohydrolase family protein [Thermoplasmata archaeon]